MRDAETEQLRTIFCVMSKDQISLLLNGKSDVTSWVLGIRHSYVLRAKPGLQCIIPLLLSKSCATHLMV